MMMPKPDLHRTKPTLSDYQKQIRFFTGLAFLVSLLFVGAFIWYLSRPSFNTY